MKTHRLAHPSVSRPSQSRVSAPRVAASSLARISHRAPVMIIFSLILVIAAMGMYLATNTLVDPATKGRYAVGDQISTSFGAISIEHYETLTGLSSDALGGMTHGIQNYVSEQDDQIQVFVTLTNSGTRAMEYVPDQFRLIADGHVIEATTASVLHGPIQGKSSIETTLGFVVPRDGAHLTIEFRDPGNAHPIVVDLGNVDHAPAGGNNDHH